jgi:hypothetical protein
MINCARTPKVVTRSPSQASWAVAGAVFGMQKNSGFFSDGVYVRTGDFLNTGNLIFIKDIESIDQVKGSN